MNNNIKFRSWNKDRKTMEFWDLWWNYIEYLSQDEETVMRFTGLKDVNGKDIYEGDIIGYWANACWVVVWEEYRWRLSGGPEWNGTITFTPSSIKGKAIIGNMYENPELLKSN